MYIPNSCYKNLYGSNKGSIVGLYATSDTSICASVQTDYEGIELNWKVEGASATGFQAWLYQPKYSQSESGNRRYGGRDNNSEILAIKNDGSLEAVTMNTDWMSAVNGIAFAATAIAATTMLAF